MIDDITRARAAEHGLPAAESHPDLPLHCFPLRSDWEQVRMREQYPAGAPYRYKKGAETYEEIFAEMLDPGAPFPAPRVTSRAQALTFPLPTSLLKLVEFAREHSWEVRMQYAQGNVPHAATGRPGGLKDSIALRFGAHPMTDRQAYAVYMRNAAGGMWAWDGIMIWGPDFPPYAGCGVTSLHTFLGDGPTMSTAGMLDWVGVIKALRAGQEAARKAKSRTAVKRNSSDEAS